MTLSSRMYRLFLFFLLFPCIHPCTAQGAIHCVTKQSGGCDAAVCGSNCWSNIQMGIDAAQEGDEIRVAKGTYTDLNTIPITILGSSYNFKQVALIQDKSLTLRGGYATTDWHTSNPQMNKTTIDAMGGFGNGRGIAIYGSAVRDVTIDGFTIQNGNATGLGDPDGLAGRVCASIGADCGGGVYSRNAHLTLTNCVINNNTASKTRNCEGGGIYLFGTSGQTTISNTIVSNNSCAVTGKTGYGGGIAVEAPNGPIAITNTKVTGNTTNSAAGGIYYPNSSSSLASLRVTDTTIADNASGRAGGIYAALGPYLVGNLALLVDRVIFDHNSADSYGAAWIIGTSGTEYHAGLLRNVVVSGHTNSNSLMHFELTGYSSIGMDHVTVAKDNQADCLVWVGNWNEPIFLNITNTILDTAPYGLCADQTGSGQLRVGLTRTILHNINYPTRVDGGNPQFDQLLVTTIDPLLNSAYRLTSGSPAIDAGFDQLASTADIDGDPRPQGKAPDIGADEYRFPWLLIMPSLLLDRPANPSLENR